MTRASDEDQLLTRLEAAATSRRRGSVVIFETWVPDATGTRLLTADPVLVPEGSSRVAAGIRFTLRSLRQGPWRLPRDLPLAIAAIGAIAHNVRGGRLLGSVLILDRRPGASSAA